MDFVTKDQECHLVPRGLIRGLGVLNEETLAQFEDPQVLLECLEPLCQGLTSVQADEMIETDCLLVPIATFQDQKVRQQNMEVRFEGPEALFKSLEVLNVSLEALSVVQEAEVRCQVLEVRFEG